MSDTVTITLTLQEAVALVNTANLCAEVLDGERERLGLGGVPPLVSAAMRLETALMAERSAE